MQKQFNSVAGLLRGLARRHDAGQIFNDFLTIGICEFHRTNIQSRLQQKDDANEKLYLNTIKPYNRKELNTFAKIMGTLMNTVYQEPYSDTLGEYYTMEITKGQNGQFFTPNALTKLMGELVTDPEEIISKQKIIDPACGSGRILLGFAQKHPDNYFYGADNNNTCAKMSTLNFFLNGLRGEVAWMNTLSMEWYGGWHINTKGLGIVPIEKEQSRIWSHPPIKKENNSKPPEYNSGDGIQLGLF